MTGLWKKGIWLFYKITLKLSTISQLIYIPEKRRILCKILAKPRKYEKGSLIFFSVLGSLALGEDGWLLGNINQYGFYRVTYSDDNWNALINQLKRKHDVSVHM